MSIKLQLNSQWCSIISLIYLSITETDSIILRAINILICLLVANQMNIANQRLKLSTVIWTVVVATILLAIALGLNASLQTPLFLMGINYVYYMQKGSSPVLDAIQNTFSLLGQAFPIITIFIVLTQVVVIQKRKILVFVHIICIFAGQFFIEIFKDTLQEPRPFWYDRRIGNISWFCPADFGNPSGHAFFVLAMYEPILSDMVGTGRKSLLAVLFVVVVLVMSSRVYLGVHSLDQVILGAFLGLFYLVIYHYKLKQFFYRLFCDILNQKYKLTYFISNSVSFVALMGISLIHYQNNIENRPFQQNWIHNISCSESTQQMLIFSMLEKTLYSFGFIGIIYGCLLLSNEQGRDTLYFVGRWQFKDGKARFLYYIAILVAGVPSVILFWVIPASVQSEIAAYILKSTDVLWGGICLSFTLPSILNKFDLISYQLKNQSY